MYSIFGGVLWEWFPNSLFLNIVYSLQLLWNIYFKKKMVGWISNFRKYFSKRFKTNSLCFSILSSKSFTKYFNTCFWKISSETRGETLSLNKSFIKEVSPFFFKFLSFKELHFLKIWEKETSSIRQFMSLWKCLRSSEISSISMTTNGYFIWNFKCLN